jgi:DNA-binding response OmpR family regulator
MSSHILLADDEPAIRYTISFVLRNAGYRVTQAADGEAALARILEAQEWSEPFDLLVTDLEMPGMSGMELLGELKKRKIVLPVLVISGMKDEKLTQALRSNGCSDFLLKPFDLREFARRAGAMADRRVHLAQAETIPSRAVDRRGAPVHAGW